MTTPLNARAISPVAVPETAEERQLQARIEVLRGAVTSAAAELEELRITLDEFEARYEARIGVLIVELDRTNLLNAKLARKIETVTLSSITHDDLDELDESIEREFADEQRRVDAEAQDTSGASRRAELLADPPKPEAARAIRSQYRKLARMFHPDVAVTEDQRAHNEVTMRRINEAMGNNDLDLLNMLEASLPSAASGIPGGSSRAKIQWATAEIARLELVLTRSVGRVAAVKASSIYELWLRCEQDLGALGRLETELRDELALARMQQRSQENELEEALKRAANLRGET